jgi:DNA repair exonuclease SbcCD ATPase subunit
MNINGLIIKSITLKNFLSVGNATQAMKLDEHGLTLVLGNNSDANGGITKNGAGKTALLQALSFGLYGQPLTKIKVGNLINNINQKGMFVVVEFDRDGVEYRVERGKKPDIIKFYKNGSEVKHDTIDNEAKGETRETQHDIDDLIGMTHTMFKHIVALNTYTEPFLKEASGKQREIIEELLGVTQISNRAELLKQLINTTKDSIRSEEAHVNATKAANSRIDTAIKTAEMEAERWARKHERSILDLAEQLDTMEAIDFEAELRKFDELDQWRKSERVLRSDQQLLSKDVEGLARDRKRMDADIKRARTEADGTSASATIARLERDLARARAGIAAVENAGLSAQAEVERLEGILAHPGEQECKTCGQELSGTDHLLHVISRVTADRDAAQALFEAKQLELAAIHDDVAEIETDIDNRTVEAAKVKDAAAATLLRLDEESAALDLLVDQKQHQLEEVNTDLKALGARPQSLFDSRDEVYTAKHAREALAAEIGREREAINPFAGQVDGLKTSLQPVDMEVLNQAHDLLRHQDFLFKLLTSKDSFIRRKIIEQNLSYLNSRLNYYLNKLGLPHDVVFQSDLSVEITLLSRDMDFAQLSRGEGNRVILATSWAFRDVWESLNHPVNLIWIDEQLDSGVDAQGAEAGLQILKGFARAGRNVFLISHRDELVGRIDRTLVVSKENGFTSITEEA